MIIKLKVTELSQREDLLRFLDAEGSVYTVLEQPHNVFIVTDDHEIDVKKIKAFRVVDEVALTRAPYRLSARALNPDDREVRVGDVVFGGGHFVAIAGPCSVESEEQIMKIAREVKENGAQMLRAGAFKPRTSPYSFCGLGSEGLKALVRAGKEYGLPVVSEITDADQLPLFKEVDMLQVGARNMQNFTLLSALGRQKKPVLLKRGFSAGYEELLLSAEYILAGGNPNVVLCERGIRTFVQSTRNTLDVSAIPMIHRLSNLPIITDPSHAGGDYRLVRPLALAATAAGSDGLIIEVHHDPEHAQSDGDQSVKPERFKKICRDCRKIHALLQEV